MKPRVLRLGFVGGGLDSAIGVTHKIAAQMDGRFRLEAGCFCTDGDQNLATAAAWGISEERLYFESSALLSAEKDRLDAVVVLTPTPTHAGIVVSAIEAGIPVICEKALATSSEEVAAIRRALEKHRGYLAVVYNYTGYPMLRELRQMIGKGDFGKICQIHIEMPQEGFLRLGRDGTPGSPQAWRLADRKVPVISLDLGVHLHHMIRFLSDAEPMEVVATQDTYGAFASVVDNVLCIARYTQGIVSQIWYSKSALGHRNGLRVRVYGERGSAEWYQMCPEVLECVNASGERVVLDRSDANSVIVGDVRYNRFKPGHPSGFIEAFANHYRDIADSLIAPLEKPNPWVFSIEEAEAGILMLEAIAASAKSRQWQPVHRIDE